MPLIVGLLLIFPRGGGRVVLVVAFFWYFGDWIIDEGGRV